MKSLKKMAELADKFERKLNKQAQEVSQANTSDLFFGGDNQMLTFAALIKDPTKPVGKFIFDWVGKNEKTAAFQLDASADPATGARWMLTVIPESLKNQVYTLLDNEYKKMFKKSMADVQKDADVKAKAGGGSGKIQVGGLSAEVE